jgi:hypothetical protein
MLELLLQIESQLILISDNEKEIKKDCFTKVKTKIRFSLISDD